MELNIFIEDEGRKIAQLKEEISELQKEVHATVSDLMIVIVGIEYFSQYFIYCIQLIAYLLLPNVASGAYSRDLQVKQRSLTPRRCSVRNIRTSWLSTRKTKSMN